MTQHLNDGFRRQLVNSLFAPYLKAERPVGVVLLCLGLGCALIWTVWSAWSEALGHKFGPWYLPYLAAVLGALVIALRGLWRMRRWSVLLLAGVSGVDTAMTWALGEGHWVPTLVSAAVVGLAFWYRPQMQ